MYAESLITPHPRKLKPEQEPQPLIDMLDLSQVRAELDAAKSEGAAVVSKAKIEAAEEIAKTVNHALWFPQKQHDQDDYEQLGVTYPLTLNEISENQVANCFGYTCTTSEILDSAGVEHLVAYGNGHAFILVPAENEQEKKQLYFIDPLSLNFNQFADQSLRRGSAESITGQLEHRSRTAFMLDTAELCRNQGETVEVMAKKHPWLVFSKTDGHIHRDYRDMHFNGDDINERDRLQRRHMIIVSAYESSAGRAMIEDYVSFQAAVARDDVPAACQNIRSLAGLYPELDARQEHKEFRQIVNALCESDQVHIALQLIEHYFENFEEVSLDSRINVSKGDCYRDIAMSCGSIALTEQLLTQAEQQYFQARQRPQSFKEQIDGKLKSIEVYKNENMTV